MTKVHPTASIDPRAHLAADVEIGPFAVIEADAVVGPGCRLAGHVVVKSGVELGPANQVAEGAVLGGGPQHVTPPAELGTVRIGQGNVFREHVTVHRALHAGHETRIGNHCYLMAGAHVAHDCQLGNQLIIANHALLGGHVTVGDRAFVSGAVAVHQFCRIGRLAMVGGQAHLTRDVPPFVTVDGLSSAIVGLNVVGLRRAGVTAAELIELKAAYRLIYRSGQRWVEILEQLAARFSTGLASEYTEFFAGGSRGYVNERRVPRAAILKLRREAELDPALTEADTNLPPAWQKRAG